MRLHHALPSYYSAIARLSLVEAGIPFASTIVDIHRRGEQSSPEYARKNPNMTVPTLERDDGTFVTDSRDILELAWPGAREEPAREHVDRQYQFPIEELTLGSLITKNPIARRLFPRALASTEKKLRRLAEENPPLHEEYLRRAETFRERIRTFDPAETAALYERRLRETERLLDTLEDLLTDGREFLTGEYGPADIVWTVFLARIHFIGRRDLLTVRPALARYDDRMARRPSFDRAEVWRKWKPFEVLRQVL